MRVDLEIKSQLDKDVSHSPVIEVGGGVELESKNQLEMCLIHPSLRWGKRDTSITSLAAVSMTEFREVKSGEDDFFDQKSTYVDYMVVYMREPWESSPTVSGI